MSQLLHVPIEAITVIHSLVCGYGAGAAWSYMALFHETKKRNQPPLFEFIQGITGLGLFIVGVLLPMLSMILLVEVSVFDGLLAGMSWGIGFMFALAIGSYLIKKLTAEQMPSFRADRNLTGQARINLP